MDTDSRIIASVQKKLKDPKANVRCPKCGKQLRYQAHIYNGYINAEEVWCETDNCLHVTMRGL